jgi:P2 family phage contractile tail tube protein
MADTRVVTLVRAIINGFPVMGSLDEFTPPTIEKEMEETKGGRFVAGEIMTGVKQSNASMKISGVDSAVLKAMGVSRSESCEITVLGSAIDEDGAQVALRWELSGEIVSINTDPIKPGKMSHSLEFSCKTYRHTDAGEEIYHINIRTSICVIGGIDILEAARGHVELG